MSKQSEAREKQGYKHEGPRCGTCFYFTSDSVPVKWMVEANELRTAAGQTPHYDLTLPVNRKETNLRCQIGGFAVKKNACCNHYRSEEE